MSESSSTPRGTVGIVADALTYPLLKRFLWWLIVIGCTTGGIFLVSTGLSSRGVVSIRVLALALFLLGLAIRCYFSVIETTLTGYGEEEWQGSGLNTEDIWSSMGLVAGVALISWAPTLVVGYLLHQNQLEVEPWLSVVGALGCEYFSMAVIGLVVFGGITGAMPQNVFPAIFRSGASYGLGALGLMFIPWTFQWTLPYFIQYGLWGIAIACAIASYFLIAQARLAALIYVAHREKIGWD
jgi:hypothetical protein